MFNQKAKLVPSKPNIFHQFGKVSYGIYMFNPVLISVILITFSLFSYQNYFIFLLAVHVSLALVTFLSYRFLEMPFLQLKEKFSVIQSGGFETSAIPKKENESAEGIPAEESEVLVRIKVNSDK